MTTLFDGTVLPSFMKVLEGPGPTGTDLSLNDYRIHVGRIVAIHGPEQSTNNNKKFFEYDVEVDIGGGVKKVYPRCVMAAPFGGFADTMSWTPRISHGTNDAGAGVDFGTRVFVLCLNGHTSRGVIIGGAKHHALPKETQEDGHHFVAVFNGVKVNVNSKGELLLQRTGPTFSDGSLAGQESDQKATLILNDKGDIELVAGQEGKPVFTWTLLMRTSRSTPVKKFKSHRRKHYHQVGWPPRWRCYRCDPCWLRRTDFSSRFCIKLSCRCWFRSPLS
jgi:hypothetical protein